MRLVARTTSCEVGVVRHRYCDCGACVTTVEHVLDADLAGCLLVEGLDRGRTCRGRGPGNDLSMVRQLVRRLGGTITELRS